MEEKPQKLQYLTYRPKDGTLPASLPENNCSICKWCHRAIPFCKFFCEYLDNYEPCLYFEN